MIIKYLHFLECDGSWMTWGSDGLWTECTSNMYLNSSTQLCQFWEYGQYYNPTKEIWEGECLSYYSIFNLDWADSWKGQWQYQTKWFQCSDDQVFSLVQMQCVDQCEDDEVYIESEYVHGLKVCRNLDYYVNPISESVLELGTSQHPYKSLHVLFRDLFNFVEGIEIPVVVHLLQSETLELTHNDLFLYNIQNITFRPYMLNDVGATFDEDLTIKSKILKKYSGKIV